MPTPARPRTVTCETELWHLARYARRLESTLAARKAAEGVPDAEIVAGQQMEREHAGVTATLRRLAGQHKSA